MQNFGRFWKFFAWCRVFLGFFFFFSYRFENVLRTAKIFRFIYHQISLFNSNIVWFCRLCLSSTLAKVSEQFSPSRFHLPFTRSLVLLAYLFSNVFLVSFQSFFQYWRSNIFLNFRKSSSISLKLDLVFSHQTFIEQWFCLVFLTEKIEVFVVKENSGFYKAKLLKYHECYFSFWGESVNKKYIIMICKGYHNVINLSIFYNLYISKDPVYPRCFSKGSIKASELREICVLLSS